MTWFLMPVQLELESGCWQITPGLPHAEVSCPHSATAQLCDLGQVTGLEAIISLWKILPTKFQTSKMRPWGMTIISVN